MKKLTWALWSLMLLLCSGVAFAQTAAPIFSPTGDALTPDQKVTIKSTTTGAVIYYTTDGTEPTAASTKYESAFFITAATTIKAIAIKDEVASEVSEKHYKLKPTNPKFTPPAGAVLANTVVHISCTPADAKIYYTTDGTTPTNESTEYNDDNGITITEEVTIKAIAYFGEGDDEAASGVATAKFPVGTKPEPPTFSPADGTAVIYGQKVTITGASGTKIYCTTNGNDPTTNLLPNNSPYKIAIKGDYTVKAIAVNGNIPASDVASATYTCKLSETSFVPAPADDLKIKQGTKIKCEAPEELAGDDYNDPEEFWFIYAEGEGADLTTTSEALQAVYDAVQNSIFLGLTYPSELEDLDYKIAYAAVGALNTYKWYFPAEAPSTDGEFKIRGRAVILNTKQEPVYGDMIEATYTVEGEAVDATLPTFSVEAGEVEAGTEVTLAPGEGGDFVLYVIDGDEADLTVAGFNNFKCFRYLPGNDVTTDMPNATPITINKGQTIKAVSVPILMIDQMYGDFVCGTPSEVAEVTYTVKDGDQLDKVPVLTVSPIRKDAADVTSGMTVEFTCTVDKKSYEDVGFAIRGKRGANAGLAKLEYRLSNEETAEWIDFGGEIGALNAGEVIAAIPDDNAQDAFAFNKTGATTVYYRMTLEGDDDGDVVMPVIAFELGDNAMPGAYEYIKSNLNTPLARTPLDIQVVPAAPVFEPADGATVDFGAELTLTCATKGAYILYTTDGSEPSKDNDNAEYYSQYLGANITAPTIKAVALLNGVYSDVVTANYTFNKIEATLSLTPMKEDTVGKNVGTGVEFSLAGWETEEFAATVYYTTDGTTVPSKADYEAQTDKVNGAIKMLSIKKEEVENWDGTVSEQIVKTDGHTLAITFDKATRLKAIGYMTVAGQNVETPVLDTMLQIKSEAKPTFSLTDGTVIKAGDELVLENPNYLPEAPEYDDFENEDDYFAAWDDYEAEVAEIPATVLYYSFDGTLPTGAAYDGQPMINTPEDAAEWHVFRGVEGKSITIFFKEDEEGLFAHIPDIIGSFPTVADTIRIVDGKFAVQVLAVTTSKEDNGGGVAPQSAKVPGGAASFMYASDFATAEYFDHEQSPILPETVKAPVFVPTAGEVEKGTGVTWTWDAAYDEYDVRGVVYVANGKDEDLNIDGAKYYELLAAWSDEDENTVRKDGEVYLYLGEEEEYLYKIEKAVTLKACLVVGVMKEVEEGQEGENPELELVLSPVVTAAYTIKGETPATTVAKPTFSVKAGEVEKGTKVEIACETEGAVIYYTVDGSTPTAESTEYKEAIEITGKVTIKAIAIKGDAKSEVAEATYQLLANEGEEELVVSVYPNPSNGLFNLELPVAATVDVFMSNGMLYQRLTLAQGSTTLNIERSGVYFLRITGEGRTVVKRVIVR